MLIGITGTDGAGKGEVVEYLVKNKGFIHFSSRGYFTRVLEERGMPIDRAHMRLIANELRATYGDDHVIRVALSEVRMASRTKLIIESIRAVAEAEALKREGGVLFAVDADVQTRYERIVGRASDSDRVTFEEFVAHEALEMNDPDPHGMQKAKVMAIADYTILNDGLFTELGEAVEKALASVREVVE